MENDGICAAIIFHGGRLIYDFPVAKYSSSRSSSNETPSGVCICWTSRDGMENDGIRAVLVLHGGHIISLRRSSSRLEGEPRTRHRCIIIYDNDRHLAYGIRIRLLFGSAAGSGALLELICTLNNC